jgi:predicted phosphodiesterase
MKMCFFGDLHGNVDALEVCFRLIDEEKPGQVYCLGDLAGWLPSGDRTFAMARSTGFPTVAGNHDLLIAGAFADFPGYIERIQTTAYNAGVLFSLGGAIEYLLSLPLTIEREDFTVVHHSPFDLPKDGSPPVIECFGYLDETALHRSIPSWRDYPKRLIFSGHDHIPAVYELREGDEVKVHTPGKQERFTLRLGGNSRYWVKAGSVGGPYRDGTPVVNLVLYDSDEQTITMIRVPYDTSRLCEALLSHLFFRNLPFIRKYVEALSSWPGL